MISCIYTDLLDKNEIKSYFIVDEQYFLLIQLFENDDKAKILKTEEI